MKLAIDYDKKLHLVAGLVISLVVGLIFSVGYGVLCGSLSGVAKEIKDYIAYGLFDKRDLFFTVVGSIVGGLIIVLVT